MKKKDLKAVSLLITYEEIGLFPRSFNRVLDRFLKQVFSDVELFVVQEYRFYRYLFLTTFQSLFLLFFVPFVVNFFAKNYLVRPLADFFWNTQQTEIFLNSYQQKRAFAELQDFEEKLYFESLLSVQTRKISENYGPIRNDQLDNKKVPGSKAANNSVQFYELEPSEIKDSNWHRADLNSGIFIQTLPNDSILPKERDQIETKKKLSLELQERLQQKTIELAMRYNNQSIDSITNFFADLFSLVTLFYLLFAMEIQINITKSFLLEVFFGLDDSKKSLLILLTTDLLVGYHSPNIWELFFESIFNRYGIPESQTGIFLLVATLPVLLDVLFKYLIFRHLNRASPATVATYHAMIE